MEENKQNKKIHPDILKWVIMGLAGFVVIVLIFGVGIFVGEMKARFSYRWAENYHKNFGGPSGGFLGDWKMFPPDNEFIESYGTFGQILKIDPSTGSGQVLRPLEMGDSDNLKVGQFVIAIGTALGEFRNTVTTGVISGLGRGVEAGSPFEGYVERLDNVIQTDAAINPGNSGGPLLNSAGQVIGVNVAVASGVENIGFALPINVIKDSLANFNKTGKFSRPFLGVRYQMISQKVALMNEVPEGAYIVEVVSGSSADKAGLKEGDIIVKVDGKGLKDLEGELAKAISQKKVGETIELEVYRDEKTFKKAIVLEEFSQ